MQGMMGQGMMGAVQKAALAMVCMIAGAAL